MASRSALLILGLCLLANGISGRRLSQMEAMDQCAAPSNGAMKSLKADSTTAVWGYFYQGIEPAMVASSGDEIMVEMITHHAGDDYEKMIAGDPGVEDIYRWTPEEQTMAMRGAKGAGEGVHILTGPIYVCDAEPGDVLQIDILDLAPRKNPSTGKTYGSNAAAGWGYQFRAGFLDDDKREVITIYEVVEEDDEMYVVPDYAFRFAGGPTGYPGPTTPCATLNGSMPRTVAGENVEWSAEERIYSSTNVPCDDGNQTWAGYYYPGVITQHPTGTEDMSIKGKFKVPANLHIGNIGLSPAWDEAVNSIPPLPTGGNMDNKRVGAGSTLYLPVQVAGALLSMGDAHTAQGDSELDGTGVETSINGKFKLTLHKAGALPKFVANLTHPLIETPTEWVVQGYTYADFLNEIPEDPQNQIFALSSIDKAMVVAYNETRDWMMQSFDMTEDQAITAITIACDFGITQVVDGNFGVHALIPKKVFKMAE